MSEYDGEPNALGKVTWHCSEEGGLPDVGISVELANGAVLWCGEITNDRWTEAGSEAAELGSDFGTWLILHANGESKVIGKCVNRYDGQAMIDQIELAVRAGLTKRAAVLDHLALTVAEKYATNSESPSNSTLSLSP